MSSIINMILNDKFEFIIGFEGDIEPDKMGDFIKYGKIAKLPEKLVGSKINSEYIFRLDPKYHFETYFKDTNNDDYTRKLVITCKYNGPIEFDRIETSDGKIVNIKLSDYIVMSTNNLNYFEQKSESVKDIFRCRNSIMNKIIFEYFDI